jgi:sugar (pentulose or hexulose) kinase
MPSLQVDHNAPIGTITLGGRAIRVWGGLGDLQAAAHGAGFPHRSPVLVNLGTGSQVMVLTPTRPENIEVRPCARGEIASAITHLSSGRALNTFASFLDACAQVGGGQPIFWRLFGQLRADAVLAAEPSFDLNVFQAAWRYRAGGNIAPINEGEFSVDWFMNTLAKSWLVQYEHALSGIADKPPGSDFLLGGGLTRRAAFIAPVLESLLGRQAVTVSLRTGEETLDGLLTLAEMSH